MLDDAEVEINLQFGYERRDFEVKGAGSLNDKPLLMKVVKAALGLGNLRGGGHVAIGIDDKRMRLMEPGLTQEQVSSWMNYDQLATHLRNYSDPPVQFELKEVALSNHARVVVLEVFEFADVPHLCAADDSTSKLRKGALYVRTRGMPCTTEFASSTEMREVLELASSKRLREYLGMAERAGVTLTIDPSADELYEQERDQPW